MGTTSPLRSRIIRLSFFWLGLLIEVSMVALFFNLNPEEEEDDVPLFWEGLVANFFVALYSTLFTILPMLLLGAVYCIPSKTMKRLQAA